MLITRWEIVYSLLQIDYIHMMLKKGQLTKQLKEVQKNNQCLRRVMEGLFYLTPDQKEGDYFI